MNARASFIPNNNSMTPWLNRCHFGDCLETLRQMPDGLAQACVTSPPYFGLRDYGCAGQIGLEPTPDEFVAKLVAVFREVRRVLRDDGTLWVNMGDSYAGHHGNKNAAYDDAPSNKGGYFENQRRTTVGMGGLKAKDLIGIPWRVAFALQADGWYLRQDIIWHKPNPMPESVRDRCTKAHEYIFLLSKSERYFFDSEAMKEPAVCQTWPSVGRNQEVVRAVIPGGKRPGGKKENAETRNRRSVWSVATRPYKGAHFATFPPALIEPCILAGAPVGGVVLDIFIGSGTTAQVAEALGRQWIGIDIDERNKALQDERLRQTSLLLEAA